MLGEDLVMVGTETARHIYLKISVCETAVPGRARLLPSRNGRRLSRLCRSLALPFARVRHCGIVHGD
jgi:hypothetical protein